LTRDHNGKIPVLEQLLNLPFLKTEQAEFKLDLRSVRISQGTFEFLDAFAAPVPVETRFHEVALELKSVRAAALQRLLHQWIGGKSAQPQGAALQFELAAVVERNLGRLNWRAEGKLVFAESTLDPTQSWYDIDTRIDGDAAAVMRVYGRSLPAVRGIDGLLGSRLKLQGNLKQQLRINGIVDFERLSVDAPELFANPLHAGNGRMQVDVQLQPKQWKISRLDYKSEDLAFALKGELRPVVNGDTELQLDLSAKPLTVAVFKKYLPMPWLAPSLKDVVGAFSEGELDLRKASVKGAWSEISRALDGGNNRGIRLEAEIRRGVASFPGGYPPLRALTANVAFDQGRLAFTRVSALAGQSRLADAQGSYSSQGTAAELQLHARGEADLGELREWAQRGILPAEFAKPISSLQALNGKSKFDIELTRGPDGAQRAAGTLAVENARLQWDGYPISDIDGDLIFTPTDIETKKVRALIHGSPVEMRWVIRNYATSGATFDLLVESDGVKAGILSSLLLEEGSLQDPGIVRGSVRYRGPVNDKRERKFSGNLELVNVQLPLHPLKQPLRQLTGKISLDENGIDFHGLKGLLVGVPASATGRWRYAQKPQLVFDFAAPDLDISYLISQIDPEPSSFYATLQAEGHVTLGRGRLKSFEFTDFTSRLILDRRTWRFPNLTLRGGGGLVSGPLTIAHKPDSLGIIVAPKIQDVPMATLLRWLEITQSEISGTVNLSGQFDTSGSGESERKRNLNGAFNLRIADGTIHRMRILIQFLNVLDLSRWFTFQLPDLNKQGIRFRAITGDFQVSQGVYHTDNLVVDSDDLRMTGAGKIDLARDEVDLLVAVRPFAGMDTAINYIPLLGRGIAAVKNSFLVASFNIKGRIDDPTITPAPLGTLSEWVLGVLRIPKSLIPFVNDEKDSGPQRPAKEPAAASNP
jgi:uncharacterized protein YhdP